MANSSEHHSNVEELFDQYEQEKLSRRDLMKALTGAATVSLLGGAAAGQMTTGSAFVNTLLAGCQNTRGARHVLLERIMNHKFEVVNNEVQFCAEDPMGNHLVFTNAQAHQEWLFGTADPFSGKGLKQYHQEYNADAVTETPGGHGIGDDLEERPGNALEQFCERAQEADLELLQRGNVFGDNYYFDDLYGLVRKKLKDTCDHCATDTLASTLLFIATQSEDLEQRLEQDSFWTTLNDTIQMEEIEIDWVEAREQYNAGGIRMESYHGGY